ncbi:chromate transporter [Pigmentiphaga soli]|uniref:Chromate transporter n=1 Tax=Pigmentiphaga soli TaxID=1007095 RepID=A0ABP8GI03_9BURK
MHQPSPGSQAPGQPGDAFVPTLGQVFKAFAKVGLTSFGGGLSGWMMRDFVHRRAWISETEFLTGLALAQSFPGVNVVNLAIWLGFRLRQGPGALMAALGIVVPPMCLAIGLAAAFASISQSQPVHVALSGVAAAAVGLSLQTGLRAAQRAAAELMPLAVMAVTFIGIFLLRLPLLTVIAAMAPLSIGLAFARRRARRPA